MAQFYCSDAAGQVRGEIDGGSTPEKVVDEQASCSWSVGDAKALKANGHEDAALAGWADEWKLIRSGGAETGPSADAGEFCQARHVGLGTFDHLAEDVMIDVGMIVAILTRRADQRTDPCGAAAR